MLVYSSIREMNRVFMVLTLLPFFAHFRPGDPHQLAAIKEFEDALPEELLREDAAWFEAWKQSGIAQQAYALFSPARQQKRPGL
mgnify:CR=1 FL=1